MTSFARISSASLLVLCALHPGVAWAEGKVDQPLEKHGPLDSYWSRQESRPFVSSRIDAGSVYVKPQLAVGYGKPHDTFVAVEAFGITTNVFGAAYAGLRIELPFLWIAFGPRFTNSYVRGLLPIRDTYTETEVSTSRENGPPSRYTVLEGDIGGLLPGPFGGFIWNVQSYTVVGMPHDRYVFEEGARAVLRQSTAVLARLGYAALLGNDGWLKLGALGEVVLVPGRSGSIWRVGPLFAVKLTDHLDGIATLTLVVSSPDSLGPTLGAWGIGGLRYRWATGEPSPKFP